MGDLAGLTGNPGSVIGIIIAALVSGGVVIRKFWFSDLKTSTDAKADVNMIERLQALLDKADARVAAADLRTDKANEERNEMVAKLAVNSERMSAMTERMTTMTEQITKLTEEVKEVAALRLQVKSLTDEVNNLRKQLNHDA